MFFISLVALALVQSSQETTTTDSPITTHVSCSNSTLLALEEFFYSTGGTNWEQNTGWLQDEFCCHWFGVETCTDEGEITKLELTGNNLAGTLPDSLSTLSSLTSLAVRLNTELRGSIPDSYGELTNLQRIYLHENSFTGTFPESFANLLDLEYIYIYRTEISGTLPSSWASLTKLFLLNLHSNHITGTLPPEWGALEEMTYLYLGHNRLTGTFPDEWAGMENLWTLSCSHNQLTGNLPHYLLEHPIYMLQAAENNWDCPVVDYSHIEKNDHWRISCRPTSVPSRPNVTLSPSCVPSQMPTFSFPSITPSLSPSSYSPSLVPSMLPTASPITYYPTTSPLASEPTIHPSPSAPSSHPSKVPTPIPSSTFPTSFPSLSSPTNNPSQVPSSQPSPSSPSQPPSTSPTSQPLYSPSPFPTPECVDDDATITLVMSTFIFSNGQTWPCADVSDYFFRCDTEFAYYFRNHQSFPRELLYKTFGDICEVTCGRCDPSISPTMQPSLTPKLPVPTKVPSSEAPSVVPISSMPSSTPSATSPSEHPITLRPSRAPLPTSPSFSHVTADPTTCPTLSPSATFPSLISTFTPSVQPSLSFPSTLPSASPFTNAPSSEPSTFPTHLPSFTPSMAPLTSSPTLSPSSLPTQNPTLVPTSAIPTGNPSHSLPSFSPSKLPSHTPTQNPATSKPTTQPSSNMPSRSPTNAPLTSRPSLQPTSERPTTQPTTDLPSVLPTATPSFDPSLRPSTSPFTSHPSELPTTIPTFASPSLAPTKLPTLSKPTSIPSQTPSVASHSFCPTINPTISQPTNYPSHVPTISSPSVSPTLSPSRSEPTEIPTGIPTGSIPTAAPIYSQPTKGPTFTTKVTFDVGCDYLCQDFNSLAGCLTQFTNELDSLISSQSLLVDLDVSCGSIIVEVSGRDPHNSLAVAFLLAYCHELPSFPTLCGPNVFSPSKLPSLSSPSFQPSRQTTTPTVSRPSKSPLIAPSYSPSILENSEAVLEVSAASSHPPFHESVGFYVVVILIFLLFVLWMYCHYGPKVKLICFCDKDDRNSIEFAHYPAKDMEVFEGGGAQTIPSMERKQRREGEMARDGCARFESSSHIVSYSAHSQQQNEGLSEPGSQLNLSEIALFSMQTDKGIDRKSSEQSQYPDDGDEFDDTHSDSGSLYGGAESPGATPKTATEDFSKRCPSASSYRVGDTSEADESDKNDVTAGGFWKPYHDDSDYLGLDEASDSALESISAIAPKSRPDHVVQPKSFLHKRRDKSSSVVPPGSYSSQEFKLLNACSQSDLTPRSPRETPGSPARSKKTKRFPRRRVLSRARYFE